MTRCYCQYFRQYNILTLKDSVSVFFLTSLIRAAKFVHSFRASLLAKMYSRFNRQFKIQPTFNWPVQRFYRQAKKWNSSVIQQTFIWPVQRFYRKVKKWNSSVLVQAGTYPKQNIDGRLPHVVWWTGPMWPSRFMQLITCLPLRTPVKQFYPLHNYLFKMGRWFGDCIDGAGQ